MTLEEIKKYDQTLVMVSLDSEAAFAQLWALLPGLPPSVSFPDPADGIPREAKFFPLSPEDVERMSLNGSVIHSHIRFTKEGRTRLYDATDE